MCFYGTFPSEEFNLHTCVDCSGAGNILCNAIDGFFPHNSKNETNTLVGLECHQQRNSMHFIRFVVLNHHIL